MQLRSAAIARIFLFESFLLSLIRPRYAIPGIHSLATCVRWQIKTRIDRPKGTVGVLRYVPQELRRSTRGCVDRSEEHTSELQSQSNLVCRLLLEKKKKRN